jgi:hypothetical protein
VLGHLECLDRSCLNSSTLLPCSTLAISSEQEFLSCGPRPTIVPRLPLLPIVDL